MALDIRTLASGFRAVTPEPDNLLSLQRQPRLTNLVLTSGIESQEAYGPDNAPTAGYALFPETPVDAYQFSYAKSDGAENVPTDSQRGLKAEMRYVGQGQSEVTDRLYRYTLAGLVDDDEPLNAVNPWKPASRAALLAKMQLTLDLELKKAALVTNDSNYGLVTTIATGAGWQQSGGHKMLDDVTAAANYLEGVTGVSRDKFRLALFGKSFDAATQSVELLARTPFALGTKIPDLADVASYLRVGSVWRSLSLYQPSVGATPVKIYGDDAVLYYPGDPARLRAGLGGRCWGTTWSLGPGYALSPFYLPALTSTAYPWQKREKTAILDAAVAVRFKNPIGA